MSNFSKEQHEASEKSEADSCSVDSNDTNDADIEPKIKVSARANVEKRAISYEVSRRFICLLLNIRFLV